MGHYGRWAPYVPVATRRANAAREASKLAQKGKKLRPIWVQTRAIATSFWGVAWCDNLENYADWANRMPRGRTYARNGSIVDLQITSGEITSLVSGSSLYKIKVSIDKLDPKKWKAIRTDCAQQVSSLLDLMRGKLPDTVLKRLTDPTAGMFPSPKELKVRCSCPDYAVLCKHVAATLYGVGHLLDTEPELFFKMRGVDQTELAADALTAPATADAIGLNRQSDLAGEDLGAIFGIDLATSEEVPSTGTAKSKATTRARKRSASPKSKAIALSEPSSKAKSAKVATRKVKSTSSASAGRATGSNAVERVMGAVTKGATIKKAAIKKPSVKKAVFKKRAGKKAAATKKSTARSATVKKAVRRVVK
ncbi:MAG: hypothetical protein EA381_08340 [Planctomycetaceae bacterium]|nr:MAG: hypothetical protein EA381_08340 [Planctomycetaceae bacterium]